MLNDNKITIGFMVEDIYTDFAKEIIHSLVRALPQNKDIHLVTIAGKHDEPEIISANQHCYNMVYNSIYRLNDMCKFDGLILSMGSVEEIMDSPFFNTIQSEMSDIPKVFIASNVKDGIVVNYNNETGIREAVNCLVNINDVNRLCMLGGRDDNADARERKRIFVKCLEDNNIAFSETNYEKTDMSVNCEDAAARLLDNNPDVQAIFCVNDAVAKGLYNVMDRRDLVPGKDIYVFGFDNTRIAGDMMPPLTSIGCDTNELGQKALELLLDMMNGKEVESAFLPTRLYGRESFRYETYEYTTQEMENVDPAFVYRMFDDCFYRYTNEIVDSKSINLRRLFFEFMTRMLYAMKRRYMSVEEFDEIGKMIDIFFNNNALEYTDPTKLLKSIGRIQHGMNSRQKSVAANVKINRLFQRMKDNAIKTLASYRIREKASYIMGREKVNDFLISTIDFEGTGEASINYIIRNFDKTGLQNAALYLYDSPVEYDFEKPKPFPEIIRLMCVIKMGELHILPKERQESRINNIFVREELSLNCKSNVVLPIFYGRHIYGLLLCQLTNGITDTGEYLVGQLGRALYISSN